MPYKQPPVEHQFKKGEDPKRNSKGKPKGAFSLTRAVKEFLLENAKDGETYGDKLKKAAVLRSIAKSDVLMKEIWDRVDGKIPQTIQGGDENSPPIKVDISSALDKIYGSQISKKKDEKKSE